MRRLLPHFALLGYALVLPGGLGAEHRPDNEGPRVGLDLSVDAAAGLRGGAARGESVHGLMLGRVEGSRAVGSAGTELGYFGSVLGLRGRGPTGKYLGDFLAASNSEGFESVRLYSWWAELISPHWSLRVGALLADEEFLGTEAGGALINSGFGWPAFVSGNTVNTGPAFFAAAPGARLAWTPAPGLTCQIGIYDGDTFDSADGDPAVNRHGLHLGLGGRQGCFIISQVAFTPESRPWRALGGAWWHTGDFSDLLRDDSGAPSALSGREPRLHSGNGGLFVALERTWGGEPGSAGSVDAHIRLGTSPENRSAVAWAADAAVAWRGPFPSRGDDVLAVGLTEARFSDDLATASRLASPDEPAPDYERVLEVSYTWKINDRFSVQPDLQWARHPGGSPALRDSLLVMTRFMASF
ncbi:MAG: carbohydrate porin [Opitutaceae bacterium]